jgi:DNA gyrase/topoisomerase IV subunit A
MTEQVNTLQLEDFFKNEYIDFSVYDNVRKLGSYIDGQKNASRKILHTVLQQNIDKFVKVSNLGPKVQDYAQYLHGSLEGTIVNMTADYVGSGNNLPLLEGDGNFGSAFINEAAATRYIFARMNPVLKQLFVKDDFVNLEHQNFEGAKIEPRYYVPTLPMLAINGSEGVSIGFAQKILPRNPAEILKWVKQRAEGKRTTANLTPHWIGMKCVVKPGESSVQWEIHGSFTRKTKHRIVIDALPVGYTLKQYQDVLEKLVEDKVIKDYEDFSDNDEFEFEIQVDRAFGERTDEWIMNKLKLIKKVSENFTCIDEDNKIVIFSSLSELLEAWYTKRIEYNNKRKQHLLAKMQEDMDYTNARARFIQGVVDEAIELRNTKESDVVKQAEAYDAILVGRVEKFLGLPMRSLTKEEIAKLHAKAKELKTEIAEYSKKTFEDILVEDVSGFSF